MATIPASAIVSVTPNVLSAGGSALSLNGLLLSTSSRVPIGSVAQFATAAAVAAYFGSGSAEATAATIYFNGFDNSNVKPGNVLFAQYAAAAVAAYTRGGNISALTLTQLQAITGVLDITVDALPRAVASLDISAATSFSSAAGIIETALNTGQAGGGSFTGSISGTVLTISAVGSGSIVPGVTLSGSGVTAGQQVVSQLTGAAGGIGTYRVTLSESAGSTTITAAPTDVAVTFDSVSGGFIITSGVTGVASTIAFATGSAATALLLTSATGAVISQGSAIAVPSTLMNSIVALTQNWATFMNVQNPDNSGNANKLLFAEWVATQNNRYAYACRDNDITATNTVPATGSLGYLIAQAEISGVCLVYDPNDVGLDAFVCGIAASLDFTETNGRADFAFRSQSGLVPTVTDETVMNNLISNGYNFYGAYGTANDEFIFLYNGSVSGEFLWMDSYVNQIQLNNAFQLSLMTLLTQAKSVPYNAAGYSLIEAACGDPITVALNYGTIRAGVTLSASQIAQVNSAAGVAVNSIITSRGWYLQVKDPAPSVRAARGSPSCTFWYTDGQSVQKINLTSDEIQ